MSKPENGQQFPAICWPVPKNNRGGEFSNLEEMLAHLEGEATGHWLIGRNGMWHGGIHITDTSTPWCALSGQSMNEAVDFPVPFKGEQPVRCMADGEVVAYRINRDYLSMPWYQGDLHYSGSFVLIRHRIQPGETAESGLTFYTLYMHLAPWLAYTEQDSTAFKVADGQHLNAYADASRQSVAAELPPGTRVIWDKAVSADTMTGSNGRQYAHVTLAEPVTGRMSLKVGDRVWTVCDKGNLVPARDSVTRPAWWLPFLPPSRETVQFDTVVCPTPYPIKAGAPVGHLGYFQVPTDNGHEKRYQVHIECLTTDDLPRFLSNPEGVGRDTPAFARCPKDIPVYLKYTDGEIYKGLITTESETVIALSGQAVTDKEGKRYWPGGGVSRGLVAESDVRLLSRYDLAGRGFKATEDNPESFDHLDGKRQPKGLVRKIFELFFNVATNDGKLYSKLVAFNYRQLLDQIDDAKSPRYNPELYRRAVQNPSMREHLYRLCVKHPSEWYYSSESPVWKAFFTPQLKRNAPEWYDYSMKFLTDLRWMYRVAGMVVNPWHMHPLVFLDAIATKVKLWVLGTTSEHYESGGRGPGVISSGKGDHGGASYGCYQLSSKLGVVQNYIQQSKYKNRFDGLQVGTQAFNAEWKRIANEDEKGFSHDQYLFIKKTHYEVQLEFLAKHGIHINHKRAAIHDMIWSTSVQYGPYTNIIIKSLDGLSFDSATDIQIITAVQDYKYDNVEKIFRSSPTLWAGLKARAISEKNKLLKLEKDNYKVE
ncbi:M23 family metallopeptidase [Escherichia coli]|nr:M23 family metallopeptidase [Escherichia coli]